MTHFLKSLPSRLLPTHQTLHILSRSTILTAHEQQSLQISNPKSQISLHWLTSPTDPLFPLLLSIQAEQGLDEPWCIDQLQSGASAILAIIEVNGRQTPAGVGLYTRDEFYVAEIDHLYHPGTAACYLYATYVSPAFRGRRIQRLLDLHRVQKGAQDGLSHALAIAHSTNTPSLRGHAASGFQSAARIDHFHLPNTSIMLVRKKTSRLPVGNFPGGGFLGSHCLHFSRT